MMEISGIIIFMPTLFFSIALFMDGFSLGAIRAIVAYLAFIPLIIGWVFIFARSPSIIISLTNASASEWFVSLIYATVLIVTSLGSGYLCGRFFKRDEK